MTKRPARRRLFAEILLTFGLCFVISLLLFGFIWYFGTGLVEEYFFNNDIVLDDYTYFRLESFIVCAGAAVSVGFFTVLFLALFGEKLGYIRVITKGVEALQKGNYEYKLPIKGNNELTRLAESVNYLSRTQKEVKEKEQKLGREKEELIRTLSHDIRTPLTLIMSYTELLSAKKDISPEEQREYMSLVNKKALQIKDLTDILLDGGHRQTQRFDDARLLFAQLAEEFEESVDGFAVNTDISALPPFSGSFDLGELQRIFDNLASNIRKYADKSVPLQLNIAKTDDGIIITQKNGIRADKGGEESYRMGINSIRRIAQNYGGSAETEEDGKDFSIIITLSVF